MLFEAKARLACPRLLNRDELQEKLEAIAQDLMVDVEFLCSSSLLMSSAV